VLKGVNVVYNCREDVVEDEVNSGSSKAFHRDFSHKLAFNSLDILIDERVDEAEDERAFVSAQLFIVRLKYD